MVRDVFISYAGQDRALAVEIASALEAGGVSCWIAPKDIITGEYWPKSIVEAISAARLTMVLLSSHAMRSRHVRSEVRLAFEKSDKAGAQAPILPVRVDGSKLEGELKFQLGGFQIFDFAAHPPEARLAELLRDVKAHLDADPAGPSEQPKPGPTVADPRGPLKIVLSYRRGAQPDEGLTDLLERRFKALGHEVFVDRQASFSLDWGRSIDERLRSADVLIPLISERSSGSEMMEWEVRTASEASGREGSGGLRLLPVRVAFEGPMAPELSAVLDAIPPFQWLGPKDDDRLVAELVAALHGPAPIRPPRPLPVGGLPLDSESYVRRPSDNTFHAAVARGDSIVLVRGARQVGKTSLIARGLDRAEQDGARVAFTDFQRLNGSDLASPEAFYKALGAGLADDLGLDVTPADLWNPARAANVNFENFLRAEVIDKSDARLVWGLDEVDRLFTRDFGNDVFALFRSWHNARTGRRAATWRRLTMLVGYATEAHLFITDLNQSPFNVGTTVPLEDFTPDQVADLAKRYGDPLGKPGDLAAFVDLVGGHPYLVNRGCFEIVESRLSMADFVAQSGREEGIFGDHLRRLLVLLAQDAELCAVVRGLLRGTKCPTPSSFYRLRAAGVISGESIAEARFRNKLYATFLKKHLG